MEQSWLPTSLRFLQIACGDFGNPRDVGLACDHGPLRRGDLTGGIDISQGQMSLKGMGRMPLGRALG